VDIDAYDSDENTPLHIAVRMNDISSATVLIAFGANSEKKNLHNQLPLDLAVGSGQLRNMLKRFALKPQFNILQRDRKYTVDPCSQHAADKIGYYLNWRREAHLTLKMEKEIAKLMNQDYINDVTESGAAFIQLNHIKHWKETRGSQSRPGSRVLFLDGGGIRGLIQLEILIEMECRLKRKITDLFDWIVGTSTGGIIALALTYSKLI
jgi:calcium-independent phospholipase A2